MVALSQPQICALEAVQSVWSDHRFFLLGAFALGHHIPMEHRQSEDLDLAVSLEMDEFPGTLLQLPGWRRHERMEQRFLSPDDLPIDILPAGEKLLEQGYVEWPGGYRMNITGFELGFEHNELVPVTDTLSVPVPSAPVIALLKMCAWLDRPSDRKKDLEDVAHLLELYVEDTDDRRFTDEMAERDLSFDKQSPFLLGHDLRQISETKHRALVADFLAAVSPSTLAALGPAGWYNNEPRAKQALEAFRRGFGEQA